MKAEDRTPTPTVTPSTSTTDSTSGRHRRHHRMRHRRQHNRSRRGNEKNKAKVIDLEVELINLSMARCAPGSNPFMHEFFKTTIPSPGESNDDACDTGSPIFIHLSSAIGLIGHDKAVLKNKRQHMETEVIDEGGYVQQPGCADIQQTVSKHGRLSPTCSAAAQGFQDAIRVSPVLADSQPSLFGSGDVLCTTVNDHAQTIEPSAVQAAASQVLSDPRAAKLHGGLQNPQIAVDQYKRQLVSVRTAAMSARIDDEYVQEGEDDDYDDDADDEIVEVPNTSRTTSNRKQIDITRTKSVNVDQRSRAPTEFKYKITPVGEEDTILWTDQDDEIFTKIPAVKEYMRQKWFSPEENVNRRANGQITFNNWLRISYPEDVTDQDAALEQVYLWCYWCKKCLDLEIVREGKELTDKQKNGIDRVLAYPIKLTQFFKKLKTADDARGAKDALKKTRRHFGADGSRGVPSRSGLLPDGTQKQSLRRGTTHSTSLATLEKYKKEDGKLPSQRTPDDRYATVLKEKSDLLVATGQVSRETQTTANMFRVVYSQVYTNTAFYNHLAMVQSAETMGVDMGVGHRSHHAATLMAQHIADDQLLQLMNHLCSNKVEDIVILVDGSETITGLDKLLAIFFRAYELTYDTDGVTVIAIRPVIYFYRILKMDQGGSAEQHMKVLLESLQRDGQMFQMNFESCIQRKLYAFVSDGANNMMGKNNGFVKHVQRWANKKTLTAIHCISHRLELSMKHAWKEGSEKIHLDRTVTVLKALAKFYKNQVRQNYMTNARELIFDEETNALEEMEMLSDIDDDGGEKETEQEKKRRQFRPNSGKLASLVEHRWVASVTRAAKAVDTNLPALYVAINKLWEDDIDPESSIKLDPHARANLEMFVEVLMNRNFIAQLAWFTCALDQLTMVSTQSQQRILFAADMYLSIENLSVWFAEQEVAYQPGKTRQKYCLNMKKMLMDYNCDGKPCETLQQFEEADRVISKNENSAAYVELFKNADHPRMHASAGRNTYQSTMEVIPILASKMQQHLADTVPKPEVIRALRTLKLSAMMTKFGEKGFDVAAYGTEDMILLHGEFGDSETARDAVLYQWSGFIASIGSGNPRLKPKSWIKYGGDVNDDHIFWSHALIDEGFKWEERKELLTVLKRALLLPMSSAEVERGFSVMNNIKTARKILLSVDNLDNRMRMRLNDVPPSDLDALYYSKTWQLKGKHASSRMPNRGMVTLSRFEQKKRALLLREWSKEQLDLLDKIKMFSRSGIFR